MNYKYLFCAIVLIVGIDVSLEYCSKFGRHLLQHQCVLTPESTEGPFYFPSHIIRKDITEDRVGLPLKLSITLNDINTCEPLSNISVEIWQCDAKGDYSGYVNYEPPNALHVDPLDEKTFLRGVQYTDNEGKVEFNTIFPGWYDPRTNHIHISSHLGKKTIHTGQLYFPNKLGERVTHLFPYNNTRTRRLFNEEDNLFMNYGGVKSMLTNIRPIERTQIKNGLIAQIIIGLDPSEESKTALHGMG